MERRTGDTQGQEGRTMETTAPSASPACPKCSYPAPEGATDCPACGIVYAKYRAPGELPEPSDTEADGDLFNPYAPPEADLWNVPGAEPGAEEGVWRAGDVLVLEKRALLPRRCVRCNRPAEVVLRRKLTWHRRAVYLALLINIVVYAIFALLVRKKAEVEVPLCLEHDRARKTWLGVGVIGLLIAGALCFYGLSGPNLEVLWFVGLLVGIAALFVLVRANQPVRPKKIDDQHVWLTHASPDFLATLPDAPVYLNL
jgi:hypothetical protein